MTQRFDWTEIDPQLYPLLRAVENHVREGELQAEHRHLIRLYASQLNGCAYCVASHSREAIQAGIAASKLLALSTFEESRHFDEAERCVLRLTREVTSLRPGVQDATYENAIQHLGISAVAQVVLAASMINLWNRLGIAARLLPPMEAKGSD